MNKLRSVSLITLTLFFCVLTHAQKRVVGYYPSWSKASYPHTAIQYKHLTHIAHAFIFPYADGSLDYSTFTFYPELISAAHTNNVKVVICVGGWDAARTPRFAQMAADTSARKKFVSSIVQFIQTYNYNGVDLDWEYPKNAADRTNMKLLVHDLRAAFDAAGNALTISMAGPATSWSGQWFDFESMKSDFDWIGIMTYDFYGAWTSKAGPNSALFGNFNKNTEGWTDYSYTYYNTTRGIPKEKLLIGIPFYGQTFNASSLYGASTGAIQQTFTNIAPKIGAGWTRYWDSEGQVPYLINTTATQITSYDDSQSVALKCAYVKTKGSGGTIIWAIGQDQYQGKTLLLEIVGSSLLGTTSANNEKSSGIPGSVELLQNYPNPFNGDTHIRYQVHRQSHVTIQLYNTLGQCIKTLTDNEHTAGKHEVKISSNELSSGVYVYRLTSQSFSAAKTMVVIR